VTSAVKVPQNPKPTKLVRHAFRLREPWWILTGEQFDLFALDDTID